MRKAYVIMEEEKTNNKAAETGNIEPAEEQKDATPIVVTLIPTNQEKGPFADEAKRGFEKALTALFQERFDWLRAKKGTPDFSNCLNECIKTAAKSFLEQHQEEVNAYLAAHQVEHDQAIAAEPFVSRSNPDESYRLALTSADYLIFASKGADALIVKLQPSLIVKASKEEQPVAEEPEQPVAEEPKPAETPVEEKPVEEEKPAEEPKEERVEEKAAEEQPAPTVVEAPASEEEKENEEAESDEVEETEKPGSVFDGISKQTRPFVEKLADADKELQDKYEEIRQEALSYGLHERVSKAGNTFRLSRLEYLKITLVGKTLRCYYRLNPKDYDNTPIPHEDASSKKAYAEIPLLFRVRSELSVRRAKGLLADMMKAAGIEKKAAKAPATEKDASQDVAQQPAVTESKAVGKYEVYPEAGEFKYRLKANNGEILIVSSGYSTRDGAKAGIETLQKNVASGTHQIITEKNGYSQFRIFTQNGARMIVSGEFYKNVAQAESAYQSVERFYQNAKIVDLDEIPESEIREWAVDGLAKDGDKDGGKFEIFTDADKWLVRLVASNGEILFVSGAYSSKAGVMQGLETIKAKLHEANPFHIIVDKQKRYQFIVESGNGATLLLGETYPSRDSALSAAKSVLSFLDHAVLSDTTAEAKNEEGKDAE